MFEDTIAAISTPLTDGAISIVRMSGEDAIAIAGKVFSRDLSQVPSHTVHYGYIMNGDQPVDEVLVSVFRAPKTYTTEDIVEINCHGGQFVTRQVLQLLLGHGARLAAPGEFTQRAFFHGRIDLSQAEAVNDLIDARNNSAARLAISGIRGSVRALLEPLIEDLLNIIAQIEVNIDYPEYEDIEQLTTDVLLPQSEEWLRRLNDILKKADSGQLLKKGLDTVIIGQPNVGKSSLLNALLEEEKAIVTDIPGTTRDIVEGSIHLGNVQLNLIDTAGLRQSDDLVERMGIEKSRRKMKEADLILLLIDGSKGMDETDQQLLEEIRDRRHLVVFNKEDLANKGDQEGIWISAAHQDIQALTEALESLYQNELTYKEPVLSNDRQIGLLKKAQRSMMNAKQAMEMGVEPDLAEIDLQDAYRSLKEILGEVNRDDLLDTLFSNFCLGK